MFLLVTGCGAGEVPAVADDASTIYELRLTAHLSEGTSPFRVSLELNQSTHLLRELSMTVDESRFRDFDGDGELIREGSSLVWTPPVDGGILSWQAVIDHRRNESGYDALVSEGWGIFRAEDLVPRAKTRTQRGAQSSTYLSFELPDGWSVVTPYAVNQMTQEIRNSERRFDLPSGWIAVGELGTRIEDIGETRVVITGPRGHDLRRLDMLALLNWTLPEIERLVPNMPDRITVVGAGAPMWRGGLSGPRALFIHADRPLISENATSTLLHEVMHTVLRLDTAEGFDWINEGLAEFYSIELLRRSGTISEARYERAMQKLSEWASSADTLCSPSSSGATTAMAVGVFTALDKSVREDSDNLATIDDVLFRVLEINEKTNIDILQQAVTAVSGKPTTLFDNLPGCRNID